MTPKARRRSTGRCSAGNPRDRVTLLRLPGHVEGEPEQPVPRDVVAVMHAADGDARWSVEILVADVDQAAAATVEHGGIVTVSPHELPRFRNAVIADPAGARLSLSPLVVPARPHNRPRT